MIHFIKYINFNIIYHNIAQLKILKHLTICVTTYFTFQLYCINHIRIQTINFYAFTYYKQRLFEFCEKNTHTLIFIAMQVQIMPLPVVTHSNTIET